jgi:hypothetical protein
MTLNERTTAALGSELMERLRSLRFCIVGCGGTGANFADMLVRTGARRLTLIDGGTVKESGLNRVLCFTAKDVGKPKVEVLERHLRAIAGNDLDVCSLSDSFRRPDQILDGNTVGQRVRDKVHDADVVFAATDTNTSRLAIEELCRAKDGGMLLCCGVRVDREAGVYEYECAWSPKTPEDRADVEGYGPENASFASIVLEATSVAFTMLLSHLQSGKNQFRCYQKKYDANFAPLEPTVT